MTRYVAFLLLGLSLAAQGAEIAGVKLEDRAAVGAMALDLNGFGVRTRLVFDVYVAALYLPAKARSAQAALDQAGPKRMTLVMLRDVGADTLSSSLVEGLKDNNTDAELAAVKPQVDALVATMQRIGEAKKGMAIDLDYAPESGTSIRVNGAPQGGALPGEAFYRALLRIWLGERPVQPALKRALLGGGD